MEYICNYNIKFNVTVVWQTIGGILTVRGLENFIKLNKQGVLVSGGVGKMKTSQFLCKIKYKLFNVYYLQSKESKGKE